MEEYKQLLMKHIVGDEDAIDEARAELDMWIDTIADEVENLRRIREKTGDPHYMTYSMERKARGYLEAIKKIKVLKRAVAEQRRRYNRLPE